MTDPVYLHGYRYSVYNRIARLALLSKKVEHEMIEVNPFADLSEAYLKLHPFGRVPALTHGPFELFETSAITRYVDRAFSGPSLQPERAIALARMDQVIAVVDAYAYWPMVRQVSSHAFFPPPFRKAVQPRGGGRRLGSIEESSIIFGRHRRRGRSPDRPQCHPCGLSSRSNDGLLRAS